MQPYHNIPYNTIAGVLEVYHCRDQVQPYHTIPYHTIAVVLGVYHCRDQVQPYHTIPYHTIAVVLGVYHCRDQIQGNLDIFQIGALHSLAEHSPYKSPFGQCLN